MRNFIFNFLSRLFPYNPLYDFINYNYLAGEKTVEHPMTDGEILRAFNYHDNWCRNCGAKTDGALYCSIKCQKEAGY